MGQELRIPLVSAWIGGVALVAVIVFAFLWQFPEFLVYLFLGMVATVVAGGLRLVVAAWLDPRGRRSPRPSGAEALALPDPAAARQPALSARAPTRKPKASSEQNGEPES